MKTIPPLPLTRLPAAWLREAGAFRLRGTFLALLAGCLAARLAATHAAPPSLQPLVQPGKWPAWPRGGEAHDVKVVGNYADVALGSAGLQMIDVSSPANCVRVGGVDTRGNSYGVAVVAGRIYVADEGAGLVVLPTLPSVQFTVRVDATPGYAGASPYRDIPPRRADLRSVNQTTQAGATGLLWASVELGLRTICLSRAPFRG